MFSPPPDESARLLSEEDAQLRSALDGNALQLWRLPAATERAFRQHGRVRIANLLRKYVLLLFGLRALSLLPAYAFRDDPSLTMWAVVSLGATALVLPGLWLCTRLMARLEDYVDVLVAAAVGVCLTAMLYCAMRLDGQYFGEMAQYETIYVLLIGMLVLPPERCATVALGALALALPAAWVSRGAPAWIEMLLYLLVPLAICMVIGFIMEHSERRNFVQTQLLDRESRRLAQLHAAAEETMRQQQHLTEFLTLVSGNPSLAELSERTLRFLVKHTGAQVGAAYHVGEHGRLRRVGAWGLATGSASERRELEPGSTLMGPALQNGECLHLQRVRADYLPVDLGMGTVPCASVLILPIVQGEQALAVIELGKIRSFSARECADAEAIRTHLAYAVAAANAREMQLNTAPA